MHRIVPRVARNFRIQNVTSKHEVYSLRFSSFESRTFQLSKYLKYAGDIFLHVGDIKIGRQHHNMTKYYVSDW